MSSGFICCCQRNAVLRPLSKHGICKFVWPHCANARWNRCQEHLNGLPRRTGGDHQYALVLRGWRLSSKTWNPTTSPWMKQLTWLRIVNSGDRCPCLVLRKPSGACQKWMNVNKMLQRTSEVADFLDSVSIERHRLNTSVVMLQYRILKRLAAECKL